MGTTFRLLGLLACLVGGSNVRGQSNGSFRPVRLLAAQPVIVDAPLVQTQDILGDINPAELVLGVTIGEESRAYPINMLTGPQREIVNDTVGGKPIAATW